MFVSLISLRNEFIFFSGTLTVHYKQGDNSEGFNATVNVLSCENKCPQNRECKDGLCICREGTTGPDCNDILCPNNCSAHLKQGYCDKVVIIICIFLKLGLYVQYLMHQSRYGNVTTGKTTHIMDGCHTIS